MEEGCGWTYLNGSLWGMGCGGARRGPRREFGSCPQEHRQGRGKRGSGETGGDGSCLGERQWGPRVGRWQRAEIRPLSWKRLAGSQLGLMSAEGRWGEKLMPFAGMECRGQLSARPRRTPTAAAAGCVRAPGTRSVPSARSLRRGHSTLTEVPARPHFTDVETEAPRSLTLAWGHTTWTLQS